MMYSGMSTFSFLPMIGILHGIGGILLMLGLLALIAWAWKSWKPHDFKKAGMWMLGIGVVLCAASIGMRVGLASMGDWDDYGPMMKDGKFFKSFDCPYGKK